MSEYLIQDTTIENIANVIRESDGTTEKISPLVMPDKVRSIAELAKKKPYIDTSKITNFRYFACRNRFNNEDVKNFDTSNGEDFSFMFDTSNDGSLTEISGLTTSNGKYFDSMLTSCTALTRVCLLDLSNAENIDNLFRKNYALITIEGLKFNSMPTSKMSTNIFYQAARIRDITIVGTIKVNSNDLTLAHCPNLTVDSMLSILNALEDNTGETTRYTVYFGSTNLAKLTDEQKAIAENKNISLG